MAKVYNKSKRTNYKGSIPGMKKGGGLSKAQGGIPRWPRNENSDSDIYTLGTDELGDPIEGPDQIGDTTNVEDDGNVNTTATRMNEQDLLNEIESNDRRLNDLHNRTDSLWDVRHNVEDSLLRDRHIKNEIRRQEDEIKDVEGYGEWSQLYIDCMRGNNSACNQLQMNREDQINRVERDRGTLVQESDNIALKRGGTVKKKRGGTILGGKYKKKRGGTVGRNGVL